MTGNGQFVEVQSTGEEVTYSKSQLDEMLLLAEKGVKRTCRSSIYHYLILKVNSNLDFIKVVNFNNTVVLK